MEASTSTASHAYGSGPRGPNPAHGAQQAQGTGPPGALRSDEQHHKPFFYIQPSQPYLPMQSLQWPVPVPMPVSYNPYYGYPGFGKSRQRLCMEMKMGLDEISIVSIALLAASIQRWPISGLE